MIVQRSVRSGVGIHLLDIETMELYEKPYDKKNRFFLLDFNIKDQDGEDGRLSQTKQSVPVSLKNLLAYFCMLKRPLRTSESTVAKKEIFVMHLRDDR